ncbi:carboxymuconolactone decarboxylase family protein [Streptomyces fuscichromogenes]|uniref:carboxymuconolactone decarboxylase family protein n=1 Tax=Streptomyces fuscichromogenes TaxID=1324013 RepID=UPI003808422A
MSTARDDGLALLRQMVPELVSGDSDQLRLRDGFATGLGEQSLESVFGRLWVRPGLDLRARSLVTLGILIALRADSELRIHFPIALRNGLTREELEEVVFHSAAYAGFPAAALAGQVGREVLDSPQPAD